MLKRMIMTILSMITGAALGASAMGKMSMDKTQKARAMSDKHLALFMMMNQWVKVKQDGKNLADYFEKRGYKRIAIYGMSYVGETLVRELIGSNINVVYGIDKNPVCTSVDVVSPGDELKEVDVVVVTAVTYFEEIETLLMDKMTCPILSLKDILFEM